jgi:tRNA nucleotidyltransferase (CCA-adding enzyme)
MEEAIKILKKLEKNNFKAYIVGGYARDRYMKLESIDIDICTSAKPEDVDRIFDDVDLSFRKFGNSIVKINNNKYEITSFRKDIKYNNRKPVIEYIESLEEDLKRRDFTINTLCIDSNKNYIDLMNSRKDIDNKIIKLVGSKEKLKEDPLRILRAIRFVSTLDFNLDSYLIKAINEYSYLVKTLSYERKKQELDKIFKSKFKDKGIKLLIDFNLDKYLELDNLKNIDINKNIWRQLNVFNIYPFSKKELKDILK